MLAQRASLAVAPALLLSLASSPLFAQATTPTSNPIETWFKDHDISVRKTFDGSKEEAKPASVLLVEDHEAQGDDHYTVDLALKISEWEPFEEQTDQQFLLYPTVEWHRVTKEAKPVNKVSGALNGEYRPFLAGQFSPDNRLIEDTGRPIVPFFILTGTYSRDLEENKHEYRVSLLGSLFSNKGGLPGGQFRDRAGEFRGRYYPYLGIEYFDPISADNPEQLTAGIVRLYFEYWPIARYLQFIADAAYREALDGPPDSNHYDDMSASLNLFLDAAGNVALGYEYQRGDDPKDGFRFRERSTVGLKFKFN